ncbi:GNAT family N-acetyltransferase [Streptomyces sp. NPDC002004]
MIEVHPRQLAPVDDWFSAGRPGPATIGEHMLTTGVGRWWADRAVRPRAVAAACAGHVLLGGTPDGLVPRALAPLAHSVIVAPGRFLPVLRSAFDRLTPWERMVWTLQAEARTCAVPRGVTVRRLGPADTPALGTVDATAAWVTASWGGPAGLAGSGHGWAAVDGDGQVLAVACTYFRGARFEDVAVFTATEHRRRGLALACVTALNADIAGRGRLPSWNCSVLNRASRLLAWHAGFRLVREYVHHTAGAPTPCTPTPHRTVRPDSGAEPAFLYGTLTLS